MSRPYRDESLSLARGPETTYLRTVISRFGGIIRVGTSVQIPPQTWEKDAPEVNPDALSFRKRTPPEFSIVTAGVPGYRGYLPNGAVPNKAYSSLRGADSNHMTRHDRFKYDRSLQPTRMPIVGYSGHMRNTKESLECYGTSHWRPRAPTSKAQQAALALEAAKKRAIDMHNPNWCNPAHVAGGNEDPLYQA